jgi:hypothetical protein
MPSSTQQGTFVMPPHGIMCFHCGETFHTYGSARDHFGADPTAEPGCLIDRVALEEGGTPERGRGLLIALRKAEAERDEWRDRALALEDKEEMLEGLWGDLRRRFGTTDPWTIADRLNNERFRADHATALLKAGGIPFDQPAPALATPTPEEP